MSWGRCTLRRNVVQRLIFSHVMARVTGDAVQGAGSIKGQGRFRRTHFRKIGV